MKKTSLFIVTIICCHSIFGQVNAVTEFGDEVILFDNGTWKAKNPLKTPEGLEGIPENPAKFEKSPKSTFLLKSKLLNVGFWINSSKWLFSKGDHPQEYKFELKNETVYGMAITEKVSLPLEALKVAAIENAQNAALEVNVMKEEYRNINGKKVLMLQMNATLKGGLKFIYFGYYFSNEKGSVQILTYTFDTMFEKYKSEMETFLNGFVETTP